MFPQTEDTIIIWCIGQRSKKQNMRADRSIQKSCFHGQKTNDTIIMGALDSGADIKLCRNHISTATKLKAATIKIKYKVRWTAEHAKAYRSHISTANNLKTH